MGAMQRVARFFLPSCNGALTPERISNGLDPNEDSSRVVLIKENDWREAPAKYQQLSQQGKTIKVLDSHGALVIQLEPRRVIQDPKAEKEIQDLLESCNTRTALSGSWFE
jgi:hypothetical protein